METVQAGTQRRRSSVPGTTLQLLVLTPTSDGCIGIDVDSGALVRASYQRDDIEVGVSELRCFDLVTAPIAEPDDDDLEPAVPEAVALGAAPTPVGRLSRRKAEKLLRPLVHPRRE